MSSNFTWSKQRLQSAQPHLDQKAFDDFIEGARKYFLELTKTDPSEIQKLSNAAEVQDYIQNFEKKVEDVKKARQEYWFKRKWDDDEGYIQRKKKEILDNFERFPERIPPFFKDLNARCDKIRQEPMYEGNDTVAAVLNETLEFIKKQELLLNIKTDCNERGKLLEYGLDWELNRFSNALQKGVPKDSREAEKFITEQSKVRDKLTQWLENFKSKWSEVPEAQPAITKVNDALKLYKSVVDGGKIKFEIEKARDARHADGSILEYGLKWQLERFVNALNSGIPKDDRYIDKYLEDNAKVEALLIQWLEDFKSKFAEYEEAQPTIKEVEDALALYKKVIGGSMLKVNIDKARRARHADGSVLEYGLDWQMERFLGALNSGIPKDDRYIDKYLEDNAKVQGLLVQWLEDFKSKFGEHEEAQPTIKEVEDALALYKKVIGGSMLKVNIDKARKARHADGSVLEYGLDWQMERFLRQLKDGIPKDDRYVDDYLKETARVNGLLIQWLEDFKSKFGEYEEAQPTIKEVEEALALYKSAIGGAMLNVNIQKARKARHADGSVLEYGLDWQMERFLSQLQKGIPTDKRFVDDYLKDTSKVNGLLIQWLEDFKSKFGEYEEAQPTIKEVEDALALYKKVIGGAMVGINIQKARDARRADGSVLEYGLDWQLENFKGKIGSGIPKDDRYVDSYLKELEQVNGLLVQWLEDFKSKFAEYPEQAQPTIDEVESALKLYKDTILSAMLGVNIQKARKARHADGSVLEYGLEWHLERFINKVKEGIPTDTRFVDEYLTSLAKTYGLLNQWLEDFKSKFDQYEEAQPTIKEVEDALALYRTSIGASKVKVDIQKARDARRADGSVLEYGLEWQLNNFTGKLTSGIPTDKRFVDDYLKDVNHSNSILIQWLEDFKARFAEYPEQAQPTIDQVEAALKQYREVVGGAMLKINIQKARDARRADGSVLEYGLDWQLENFNNKVKSGIPTDKRFIDDYLNDTSKANGLLIQWLEDFKSKFGQYEEAQDTIKQVEEALVLYKTLIGASKVKIDIDKARDARRADGSILEYGLDWQLENFNNKVKSGIPTDKRFVDDYLKDLDKTYGLLIQWLEDFKAKFAEYPEQAQPTIDEVEAALKLYKDVIGGAMLGVNIQRARDARRADGSILEYGLDWQLENFNGKVSQGIPTDSRFVDDYLKNLATSYGQLNQWLEDFKSRFGQYPEAQPTITQVETALANYRTKIGASRIKVEVQKALEAKRAEGSILEYGFAHHINSFSSALKKGIPTDKRFVDDYLIQQTRNYNLLVEWLEDFKARFADYPEEITTPIAQAEEVLKLYKTVVEDSMLKINIQKARDARRADGSVLEYGLDWQLERFVNALKSGLPSDMKQATQFTEQQTAVYNLLVQWLEDFKSKFGQYPEAQDTITQVESALRLYTTVTGGSKLKLEMQKAVAERTILEYGLEWHLNHFTSDLNKGIPEDKRHVDEYLQRTAKTQTALNQWLEDFKAKFAFFEEAIPVIEKVEAALKLYKQVIGASKVKIDIQKARDARRVDGSILEYGLDWQLESFVTALQRGIPQDSQEAQEYVKKQSETYNKLVQWLEDFKARFAEFPESQETIAQVENALRMYVNVVGGSKLKLEMQQALEDRSILPYGLKHQLEQLNSALAKGKPSNSTDLDNLRKSYTLLVEWLADFKARFAYVTDAKPHIIKVENALKFFEQVVGKVEVAAPVKTASVTSTSNKAAATRKYDRIQSTSEIDLPTIAVPSIFLPKEVVVVEATAQDRYAPENLAFAAGIMKEVASKENSLKDSLGKHIILTVDWEFSKHPQFTTLNEEDQKKCASQLGFGLVSKLITGSEGLSGLCEKNKVTKRIVNENIQRIILGYNAEDKVNSSTGMKDYELTLNNGTLVIEMNLSLWKNVNAIQSFDVKLDALLNLVLIRAVGALDVQKTSIENALLTFTESKIGVEFDLDFATQASFTSMPAATQATVIEKLVANAKKFLVMNDGLGEICKKSEATKKTVVANIKRVVVTYDAQNFVSSSIGLDHANSKEYQVLAEKGSLNITINLSAYDKTFAGFDEKLDAALGLAAVKSIDAAKTKFTALEQLYVKKIGRPALMEVDWSFASHPNFLQQPVPVQRTMCNNIVQTHLNKLITADSGLLAYFDKAADLKNTITSEIERVVIRYDATNSIKSNIGSAGWFVDLDDEGELSFNGNLSEYKNDWTDLVDKLTPVLQNMAMKRKLQQQVTTVAGEISQAVGKTIQVILDSNTFCKQKYFLAQKKEQRAKTFDDINNKHLRELLKVVRQVAEHPIGKEALQKLSKFVFLIPEDGKNSSYNYSYSQESQEFTFQFGSVESVSSQKAIDALHMRWTLKVAVPIAHDLGIKDIQTLQQKLAADIGFPIAISLDWDCIQNKQFLGTTPANVVQTIETLSNALPRVVANSIVDVCTHPIGKNTVQANLKQIHIQFDPLGKEGKDSKLSISGNTVTIAVNPKTLHASLNSRYKERIEFEYDIVVAIAKDNASARHKAVETKLAELLGTAITIELNLDTFAYHASFKGKPPAEQADIITALYASLPELVFSNHLVSILHHPIGKQTFLAQIKSIRVEVDVSDSLPADGTLTNQQGVLVLKTNLSNTLELLSVMTWKDRLLDLMGILLEVACLETEAAKQQLNNAVNTAFGKSIEISVDYTFVKSSEFLTFVPSRRTELIKTANTKLIEALLIGNSGITGNQGLCEFKQVIDAFNAKVNKIQVVVETTQPAAFTSYAGTTLSIHVSLDALNKGSFEGSGPSVEQLFNLRPIRQDAAIQRANERINTSTTTPLATVLGKTVPVQVDWASFTNSDDFKKSSFSQYVPTIDRIASVVPELMVAKGKGFNSSVGVLASHKPSLLGILKQLSSIVVKFDPANSVSVHYGKSHSLVARCFVVEHASNVLTINTNVNLTPSHTPGAGRVVQFKLTPAEASSDEESTIQEIIEDMRRQEESRRADDIRRVQDRNSDAQKQFQRDQERYQKDMQDYHKELKEKCYSCSGKGKKKCGVCAGRGHNTNNNHTSTCSSCKGRGELDCSNCDGTALKHPRGLNEPRPPSAPHLDSIPTFGPMPNFRSMI